MTLRNGAKCKKVAGAACPRLCFLGKRTSLRRGTPGAAFVTGFEDEDGLADERSGALGDFLFSLEDEDVSFDAFCVVGGLAAPDFIPFSHGRPEWLPTKW